MGRVWQVSMGVLLASFLALAAWVMPASAQARCGATVTVMRGDTLSGIAARCGSSVAALLAANPSITNPNRLQVGQVLVIPGAGAPDEDETPPSEPTPSYTIYTVVRGDWLSSIARRFGTTVEAILALNPQIRNPNRLIVGQRIRIPSSSPTPGDTLFTRTKIYLVAIGDEGLSGKKIGCGDSLVPVTIEFEPTVAVLRTALNRLLSLEGAFYGQSGLYNALYQSDLVVDDVQIVNREAFIYLSGSVAVGGTCDTPRFVAQLEETALQYATVDKVTITVNGRPLSEVLQ